jgi:hypothetical protein
MSKPPPKPDQIDIIHHDTDPRTHLLDSIRTISAQNEHDAVFDKSVIGYNRKSASTQPKRHYLTGYALAKKQASEAFWQPDLNENLFVVLFLLTLAFLLTQL